MALSKDDRAPTYRLYGEQSQKGQGFWAHIETIASRSSLHSWEIKPHRHEDLLQLLYIRSGEADVLLASGQQRAAPPAIIIMPPGHAHGFRFSRDVEGLVLTVIATPTSGLMQIRQLRHVFAEPRLVSLTADDPDAALLVGLMQRFQSEFLSMQPGRDLLMDSILTTALVLASRLAAATIGGEGLGQGDEARIEQLVGLIMHNMPKHKTAEFYARELNLSVSQLNRVVRAASGQSVHELIVAAIIDQAKRALLFSQLSVRKIGDRLGFVDAAYFTRFFTRETGETPSKWRAVERIRMTKEMVD